MSEHVISGLARRRAELAGEIEATHKRLAQMIADLGNIDATILQFDPSFEIDGIRPKAFRPPDDWSKRGEMARTVLSILRTAAQPMTTRDIAIKVIADRGLDPNDARLVRLMRTRCACTLRYQRDKGRTRSIAGPGMYNLWEMAVE